AFQPQTSALTSSGDFLTASILPYFVIPLPSDRWDHGSSNIDLGNVAVIIYNGQVSFGIFGDEGPEDIIGEASYAMAKSLGIDPNPNTGGVDDGVTYLVFTGADGTVMNNEDHDEAVQ